MANLPEIALAVRQPWAWAIIHAGKDIENRDWAPYRSGWRFRGRVAILASQGMTQDEYAEGRETINRLWNLGWCPPPHELIRGAIIGSVEIAGVANKSTCASPWMFARRGFILRNPIPCDPIPAQGQLDFFKWKPTEGGRICEPARWMLPKAQEPALL